MKGSSINGGRNLKGIKLESFMKSRKEKEKKKQKKQGVDMKIDVEEKAHKFFIGYPNIKRKEKMHKKADNKSSPKKSFMTNLG